MLYALIFNICAISAPTDCWNTVYSDQFPSMKACLHAWQPMAAKYAGEHPELRINFDKTICDRSDRIWKHMGGRV
jgi:hypothetical protein